MQEGKTKETGNGHGRSFSVSKKVSLRASAHTGVAISQIFEYFQLIIRRYLLFLGDRHTSLRTGSR